MRFFALVKFKKIFQVKIKNAVAREYKHISDFFVVCVFDSAGGSQRLFFADYVYKTVKFLFEMFA